MRVKNRLSSTQGRGSEKKPEREIGEILIKFVNHSKVQHFIMFVVRSICAIFYKNLNWQNIFYISNSLGKILLDLLPEFQRHKICSISISFAHSGFFFDLCATEDNEARKADTQANQESC